MLRWALAFFVISLVAALFGFGGISESAAGIGKLLFYGFVVLTGIAVVAGLLVGKKAAP